MIEMLSLEVLSAGKPKHWHLQLNYGPTTRAGCPGAPKPAATEVGPAPGAAKALWGCRRDTAPAGMKSGTTPAQGAQRVEGREEAGRSQAGLDGNLLCCPVLKSFGRCVRTGLFSWNASEPANKCLFNSINVSAQKLWPDSQRSTAC